MSKFILKECQWPLFWLDFSDDNKTWLRLWNQVLTFKIHKKDILFWFSLQLKSFCTCLLKNSTSKIKLVKPEVDLRKLKLEVVVIIVYGCVYSCGNCLCIYFLAFSDLTSYFKDTGKSFFWLLCANWQKENYTWD